MAKEQNLPLNPMKISGLCGRLMCCLKYEQEQYVGFRKEAPRCGSTVETDVGSGVVIGYQVPKDSLTVRFADGTVEDVSLDTCSCGGSPCRRRAESEFVPADDSVGDSVDDAVPAGAAATVMRTPAEPEEGEGESPASAEASPERAADPVRQSESGPDDASPAAGAVGEPSPGDADRQGDEAAPRRRSRRRRRRPRASGDGGNPPSE